MKNNFKKLYQKLAQLQNTAYLCIIINTSITKNMTTHYNATKTKAVNITTSATGTVNACFVQIYQGEQDLIEMKQFANTKNAEKWATKKLV